MTQRTQPHIRFIRPTARRLGAALLVLAVTGGALAGAAEAQSEAGGSRSLTMQPIDGVARLATGDGVFMQDRAGAWWRVALSGDGDSHAVRLVAVAAAHSLDWPAGTEPAGALAGSRPAVGDGAVRQAWLTRPTARYRHGVFGIEQEAAGLMVRFADGAADELVLEPPLVFEDRRPLIVDLGPDGGAGVVSVLSAAGRGAALVFVSRADGQVAITARGPAIGQSNRWLNPIGAADLDGDGRVELAAVVTPHIGGTLTIYRRQADRLEPVAAADGFSNHAFGSEEQSLATIGDLDNDGRPEVIVPAANQRAMRIMVLHNGQLRETGRIDHGAAVSTNTVSGRIMRPDGQAVPVVAYGLADGRLVVVMHSGGFAP